MAIIGSMEKFNVTSDEWIVYQEQMEQFFAVNKIEDSGTEKKKVAALLSLVGSDTYKILRDLCTPEIPKNKTYEELCKLLKKHFSPATCTFRERIEFYEARQEENESINKWHARIHNLATNCEFGNNLMDILKDKFLCGLRKGKIRDRLCEEASTTTLTKLMEIALSKENAVAESREIHVVRRKFQKPGGRTNKFDEQHPTQSNQYQPARKGKWTCNACGSEHTGNQRCKYISYKCNTCKKIGHLAKVCRNKSRQQQNLIDAQSSDDSLNEVEIYNISFNNVEPIYAEVILNDVKLKMQVDSGAAVSIITEQSMRNIFAINC